MPKFTVVAIKCGLTGAKTAKIYNFWYQFAPKCLWDDMPLNSVKRPPYWNVYPLNRFFLQNLARRTESQARIRMLNSPMSLLKCGLTAHKIAKIGIFWYKFAQREYIC